MANNEEIEFSASTIENIDAAVFEFIDEGFNLHTNTNKGKIKVPVLWVGAERAFQIKNNYTYRDGAGKLVLPLMSVERTSVAKDPTFKGAYQADFNANPQDPRNLGRHGYRVAKRVVKDVSSNYAKNQSTLKDSRTINSKKVYEEILVPFPVHVTVSYSITLRTEYQQQMNDLIAPFITRTGGINSFSVFRNGHRYEVFVQQDFSQENNLASLGEDERTFKTKIDLKVLGYLVGDGENDPKPKAIKTETIVEVKIIRERAILKDEVPWLKRNNKYRQ